MRGHLQLHTDYEEASLGFMRPLSQKHNTKHLLLCVVIIWRGRTAQWYRQFVFSHSPMQLGISLYSTVEEAKDQRSEVIPSKANSSKWQSLALNPTTCHHRHRAICVFVLLCLPAAL